MTPSAAPIESRFIRADRDHQRAEDDEQEQHGEPDHDADEQRQLGDEHVREVDAGRRHAAHQDGCAGAVRDRREHRDPAVGQRLAERQPARLVKCLSWRSSCGTRLVRQGGVRFDLSPGEREEHVVETRLLQLDRGDRHPGRVEAPDRIGRHGRIPDREPDSAAGARAGSATRTVSHRLPTVALSSGALPHAATRPRSRTAIVSARRSASSRSTPSSATTSPKASRTPSVRMASGVAVAGWRVLGFTSPARGGSGPTPDRALRPAPGAPGAAGPRRASSRPPRACRARSRG